MSEDGRTSRGPRKVDLLIWACALPLIAWLNGGRAIDAHPHGTSVAPSATKATPSDNGGAIPALRQAMSEGVDITVSRIGMSGAEYMDYGVVDGIAAFSASPTACNIGTEEAEWLSGGTDSHPIATQNLYRLSGDGLRFEMIGMSWVLHEFCAVNESTCGQCQSTNCTTLGIGCASTHTSFTMGNSVVLGPRRDINPMGVRFNGIGEGTHQHPYVAPTGDPVISGRLQAHTSDLGLPGARYYIELHYVTHDEPLGNRYDNASWVSVDMPDPPNFQGIIVNQGGVRMGQVALQAWQESDPDVMIQPVDEVQGGRFHLAYRVMGNSDGPWHYEYALHNLNSHLAGRSFTIPVPDDVQVSNIAFHDVDYHSGDGNPDSGGANFDSTDWSVVVTDQGITWATESFDQNPNANALRWSTTYNFRFDADAPPHHVVASIGHYRSPTPGDPPGSTTAIVRGPSFVATCPGDLDGDDLVRVPDLIILLSNWGPCVGCEADLSGDGVVNTIDLVRLLSAWGACF